MRKFVEKKVKTRQRSAHNNCSSSPNLHLRLRAQVLRLVSIIMSLENQSVPKRTGFAKSISSTFQGCD